MCDFNSCIAGYTACAQCNRAFRKNSTSAWEIGGLHKLNIENSKLTYILKKHETLKKLLPWVWAPRHVHLHHVRYLPSLGIHEVLWECRGQRPFLVVDTLQSDWCQKAQLLCTGQVKSQRQSFRWSRKEEIGLKIYWARPCPSEQDPVSPSVSLSHQEASISLLSFSIRGHTDRKPPSQKTNQSDLALSNSIKLWAMPCRATQDRWVMVESSDNMWSTGEGNGKPRQYSCLENPWTVWKGKKDRTLKDELPR